MEYALRAREVLDCEIDGMRRVRARLGREFNAAVAMILKSLKAGGKIVVTGIGKNLHIAEKMSATLTSTGATSVVLNPAQAMHGDLGVLAANDILLALSYSGESSELNNLIPLVRRRGIMVITITGYPDSSMGRCSDIVVPVTVPREACPFNMAPTTSTTTTLAVGDALAIVLLEARGFRKEDYAKLHPGGAIGRALLLKVRDIMRTGERLAAVRVGSRVKDAILAMTRARSGSAGVVARGNRLVGIFTDGDLRRNLPLHRNLIELRVDKIMTPSPVSVREDVLAVDVLRIFEERSIDDLLVVDARGRLVGAVDIQDLPKLKIM